MIDRRALCRPRTGIGALVGSRYNIEIDWAGPRVCAAYPRESLGYVHITSHCP